MGGNAFAQLSTPRMPPTIYNQVLKFALSALRQHYTLVEAPIEAPGKETIGDVDILVSGALEDVYDPTITPLKEVASRLQTSLGAVNFITEKGNPTINLALPWPSSDSPGLPTQVGAPNEENRKEEKFIQLDIHHLSTPSAFAWELFHSAHGDLWNILGTTIRPFGLTVNDRGFYLRIPDIELLDRKKSMIFLTDQPKRVLDFLGLDEKKWWKGFESREEMFQFASNFRMFWVKTEGGEGDVVGEIGGQEGGEEGKKKLKHNDRQRMNKRPIFRAWIDEFIPKCRASGKYGAAKVTREQIQDEAFESFGVKEEYEIRLKDWKMVRHKDELWRNVIKGSLPEDMDPALRGAATRYLKCIIMEGEPFDGQVVEAANVDEDGFYDLDKVRNFVQQNWERAGEIGWERQQIKAKETMRIKAEKRKREQEEKEKYEKEKINM
ncbi:hypothetical protein BGZ60DRAFT_433002 [Tricladium varicosporioides]|nr:hypothetical protein BGZ60DRAFT_433002 [Hymenoscyphus varicosporioides]